MTAIGSRMLPLERRTALALASVFFMRMLGLFIVLPVLAIHARDLGQATPLLIGLALGAYGLTQALLQIPFGVLSDRLGRKRVILFGLLLFSIGSVLAAVADHIWLVIAGRALQGAGAVAAAVMALAADLSREEQRIKIMALIGMSIGLAFMAALVAGPLLAVWWGVDGLFWLSAGLAVVAMLLVIFVVPTPHSSGLHREAQPVVGEIRAVLRDPQLLRLDLGIALLHGLLTAVFVVVPLMLVEQLDLPLAAHGRFYVLVMLASVGGMIPALMLAHRPRLLRPVLLGAIALLGLALLWLAFGGASGIFAAGFGLWLFFCGFNVLEALLPSLVSRRAPVQSRGTAMGVYTSAQFLGAFLGGVLGGWALGAIGAGGVFLLGVLLVLAWVAIAWGMREPPASSSLVLGVGDLGPDQARDLARRLTGVTGVVEAVVVPEDRSAYLKVDRIRLDREALGALCPEQA